MQSGLRLGLSGLRGLVTNVGRGRARQLLNLLQPAAQMSGVRPIQEGARRAAVNAGLVDEITAFPSVVSQLGENLGLTGTRSIRSASQLGQAPRPQFGPGSGTPVPPAGSRPVNQLRPQPYQGPRTRGGDIVPTTPPTTGSAPTRTRFTEDLVSTPATQGPARPPVQGPSMTGTPVQGQLDLRFGPGARSAAEFTTGRGAVRPAGTNIAGQPYRGGPVATERNLETLAINRAASEPLEQAAARVPQGQGSFFLDNAPDIWTDAFRMRPELIRQLPADVQRRIGTTMMREAVDLGPTAPRPAFGPGAGPAPADSIASQAFARNAALGNELVDLGAMLNDPKIRALVGLGGAAAYGTGVAAMMGDRDRTGETTAGSPPTPPILFTEPDGSPLGSAPGVELGLNPPSTGNIDPSAPAPVVTGGNTEQNSAIREALAQAAPGAAAVMRAAEPMSPEKYRSIEEYAAARQAYAQAQPEIQALMRYMETQSPTAGGGLAMWASRYPNYAAEYQARQMSLRNPAANQQSAEAITTTTVTSPIGSNVPTAAVGNAAALADVGTNPSAAAFDMADVTRPQVQPNLQRVQDFIQRQAPRSAMYAGY